jgi:hypothetical protein
MGTPPTSIFDIGVVDDVIVEGNESFLSHSAARREHPGANDTTTVTITDNDTQSLILSTNALTAWKVGPRTTRLGWRFSLPPASR